MDIFTTQLTRVVPVPIKTTALKVKALVKEAETGKLKEDPDHLENHDYYFTTDDQKAEQQAQKKQDEIVPENSNKEEDGAEHLDIFV